MRRPSLSALAALLLALPTLPGCSETPTVAPATVAEVLASNQDYAAFAEAAEETGVLQTLRSGGPYTVLAPTNIAFNYVGTDALPVLTDRNQRGVLSRVLRHHVIPGVLTPGDFADGAVLTSLEGASLTVRRIGEVVIVDGATLDLADRTEVEDGIVYPASNVIRTNLTVRERILLSPSLSTFARFAERVGALDDADALSAVTVLVPTDDAFRAIEGTRELLDRPDNGDVLRRVVGPHILSGRLDLASIPSGTEIETLDGLRLEVTNDNGVLRVGGIRIVREAVDTADGRIYLLGGVLFKGISLADRLRIQPRLTTFPGRIREEADIWARLQDGDDNLTVFAPLDGAYIRQNLDVALELSLPDNAALLQRTRRVLVVEGRHAPEDLADGQTLQALDGSMLTVRRDADRIFVGGRAVTPTGAEADNGVLYTTTEFVLPTVDAFDSAILFGYTEFARLVRRTDLESLFRTTALSLFPPTNEAIRQTGTLPFLPQEDIRALLRYHASEEILPLIVPQTQVTMLDGASRSIVLLPFDRSVAPFLDGDIRIVDARDALNGIGRLFPIEAVRLPSTS